MSSYHRMRRQARRARRSGLQPIMVINSGDEFPPSALAVIARLLWRYRSELAPAYVALAVLVTAWWAHADFRRWWEAILGTALVAGWALVTYGAHIRIAALAERLYAATVTVTAGAWLAVAAILGPLTAPLPAVLGIGTFILAIPWWAHRRRRAKIRVERTLAAWPDISRAIGLPGSQVMSATVDLWGWRTRLRLARGQTIADVTVKIPAIESALGTFRGAVRVHPTPDDRANRCELRVLDTDPHAEAIGWPGPSARSVTEPVELGPSEDAEPCRVSFLRRHALFAGTTGSGKSGGLNVLMGTLAACDDVVIWAIDLKKGMELRPWAGCIDRLATTPAEATALLADAVAVLQARAAYLAETGQRVWEPSPEMPALVIIIDEYAELADEAPDAVSEADSVARLGRAVAVTLVAATQRPTQKAMGQGAVRSQMDTRICFRVRERKDVDLVLGQGMLNAGWHAHTLNAPGKFLVSAPGHTTPRRARAYLVTDDDVARTVARYAPGRTRLDDVSRAAILPGADSEPDSRDVPGGTQGDAGEPAGSPDSPDAASAEDALWFALCIAPDEGADIGELMRASGMSRPTLYRYLTRLAREGRALQAGRGRWRAITAGEAHDE